MIKTQELEELAKGLLEEFFPKEKVDYSFLILDRWKSQSYTFEGGEVSSYEKNLKLFVKGVGIKDTTVYFVGDLLDLSKRHKPFLSVSESLKKYLRSIFRKTAKTDILFLKRKLRYLEKLIPNPPKEEDFFTKIGEEWKIDENCSLIDDLKTASKIDRHSTNTLIELEVARDIIYFYNSFGTNLFYDLSKLYVSVSSILDEIELSRKFGFSPVSLAEKEIKKIYDLIPYTISLTPQQNEFRKAKSFTELAELLAEEAYKIDQSTFKLPGNAFPVYVISPSQTFIHEIISHNFEAPFVRWEKEPKKLIVERGFFTPGLRIAEKYLNVKSNPRLEINGIKAFGYKKYDLEGNETYEKNLINNGIVTKRKLGSILANCRIRDKGDANAGDAKAIPMPRMSITLTFPYKEGPRTVEEFIEMNYGNYPVILFNPTRGFMNSYDGRFVLGQAEEYGEDFDYEIYFYDKSSKDFIPVKKPCIIAGNAMTALKNVMVGNKETLSIEASACEAENPTLGEDENDEVDIFEVGPLIGMEATLRTFLPFRKTL